MKLSLLLLPLSFLSLPFISLTSCSKNTIFDTNIKVTKIKDAEKNAGTIYKSSHKLYYQMDVTKEVIGEQNYYVSKYKGRILFSNFNDPSQINRIFEQIQYYRNFKNLEVNPADPLTPAEQERKLIWILFNTGFNAISNFDLSLNNRYPGFDFQTETSTIDRLWHTESSSNTFFCPVNNNPGEHYYIYCDYIDCTFRYSNISDEATFSVDVREAKCNCIQECIPEHHDHIE